MESYWTEFLIPIMKEILSETIPFFDYLDEFKIEFSKLIQEDKKKFHDPNLLIPLIELFLKSINIKHQISLNKPWFQEFNVILQRSALTNLENHKKILQFYEKFLNERSISAFRVESHALLALPAMMEFNFPEIIQDISKNKFPLVKIIRRGSELKRMIKYIDKKRNVSHMSEEDYQQDIDLKFNLILNCFEIYRVFYQFLTYLFKNITNPNQAIKTKKKLIGWGKYQTTSYLFSGLKDNTTLGKIYPNLFKHINTNFKNARKFRNSKGHDQPLIKQSFLLKKE
jgi:hypothetical protein